MDRCIHPVRTDNRWDAMTAGISYYGIFTPVNCTQLMADGTELKQIITFSQQKAQFSIKESHINDTQSLLHHHITTQHHNRITSSQPPQPASTGLDWIVQCFMSPPKHYRLYGDGALDHKISVLIYTVENNPKNMKK